MGARFVTKNEGAIGVKTEKFSVYVLFCYHFS